MHKNRTLLIITIILLVLAIVLMISRTSSTYGGKRGEFAVVDTASITSVKMTDNSGEGVMIERQPSGLWQLNDSQVAHHEYVQRILETLANLEVREPVAKSSRDKVIAELSAASTKVEVYQRIHVIKLGAFKLFPYKRNTRTFNIGLDEAENKGTYALMKRSDSPVVLYTPSINNPVASSFSTDKSYWSANIVFSKKLNEIKLVKVAFMEEPAESFVVINEQDKGLTLVRTSDNSTITGYDTAMLVSYMNSFTGIVYEGPVKDPEQHLRDSIVNSPPVHQITIQTIDGQTQSIRTYRRSLDTPVINEFDGTLITHDRDRMFALVNERDFVIIQLFTFDKILLPLSTFTGQQP